MGITMLKYAAFSEYKNEQFLKLAIITEKGHFLQTIGISMLPCDLHTSNNKSGWL